MGGRVYLKGKPDWSAAGVRRGGEMRVPSRGRVRRCVGTEGGGGAVRVVWDGRSGGWDVETACSEKLGM